MPSIHMLHTHDYGPRIVEKRAVKVDDILRFAFMHDLQFSHNSFADLFLCLDMYYLDIVSFEGARVRGMKSGHSPCVPSAYSSVYVGQG